MNHQEILALPLEQISKYVEGQVKNGHDRAAVIKEIAKVRKDVTFLSVHDDLATFQEKIRQSIAS